MYEKVCDKSLFQSESVGREKDMWMTSRTEATSAQPHEPGEAEECTSEL